MDRCGCAAVALTTAVLVGCTGPPVAEGPATVAVTLTVPAGAEPPRGMGRLERVAHAGEQAADGTWLVPPVAPGPLGTIAYGERRVIPVPGGLVTFEVRGFEEISCPGDDDTSDTAACWFDGWRGRATVAVGLPAEIAAGADASVEPGSEIDVALEVRGGCACDG